MTMSLIAIKPSAMSSVPAAPGRRSVVFAGLAFLLGSATSMSPTWACPFNGTSAALPAFAPGANAALSHNGSAASRIGNAKRLSGLTWDELSRVMSTTRRTLHLWANGRSISSANEERLSRLVGVLQVISRGTGKETRQALLTPMENGLVPFDLLVRGRFDDVAGLLGQGQPVFRSAAVAQSTRERALRRPASPIALLDAAQDPIGVTLQTPLPSKAVRRPTSRV